MPTRLPVLFMVAALACAAGCSDEPVGGEAPGAGGSGGETTAGSGGLDSGADAAGGHDGGGLDATTGGAGGFAGADAAPSDAAGDTSDSSAEASGGGPGAAVFDCPAPGDGGVDPDASASQDASSADAGADGGAVQRVRIVAANLTSDNYQAYEAPGIRIFQGLHPDIVLVQEFKYRHGTLRDLIDAAFGPGFCFFREAQVGGIPNGVVSRYPITDHGEWKDASVPDRDFAWARIDVPGPNDLWAVSVHMKTSTSGTRAQEAQDLVGYVQAQVPSGARVVIGGDLNTTSTGETAVSELSAVVDTSGARPADQNGNDRTNANRNKPYDWLLPDSSLALLQVPVQIGASVYPSGLVFDSRVYSPLSEVAPVQAGDSGVVGMQHMAVVKDFVLPLGP